MNLKQFRRQKGRAYLSIEKAYRDQKGKPRSKTVLGCFSLFLLQNSGFLSKKEVDSFNADREKDRPQAVFN